MRPLIPVLRSWTLGILAVLIAGAAIAALSLRSTDALQGKLLLRIPPDHESSAVAYFGSGLIQGYESGWFPVWNADASAAAYIARKGGRAFVVSGGWIGPPLNTIAPPLLVSADGSKVVYQGSVTTEWGQGWVIVVNNTIASNPFLGPLSLAISPDGSKVAYAVVSGDPLVGIGDRRAGAFEEARGPVVFSADGSRIAAAVRLKGSWRVCVGDAKAPESAFSGLQFTFNEMMGPLGDASAYRWLVVPEMQQPGYDDIAGPSLSDDGKTIAYAARKNGKWFVPKASLSARFDEIGAIAIRADGSEVAYAAREGASEWFLIRGTQKIGPYEGVGDLAYSPDGARLAMATKRNGKWSMQITPGGAQEPEFDTVSRPTFSRDGRRLAYVASAGKQEMLVVGPQKTAAVDKIGRPRFSSDGSAVTYGSLEGREVWARVITLNAQDP